MSRQIEAGYVRIIGSEALPREVDSSIQREVKPKGYWQDKTNVENELKGVIAELDHFPTQRELAVLGKGSLIGALQKTGGVKHWREQLGHKIVKRENGYWDQEDNVQKELERVFAEHDLKDFPSTMKLRELGEVVLTTGIRKTGGYGIWRERFGFSIKLKPRNFWTAEEIENQAANFLESHGELSQSALTEQGRFDLQVAIGRHFPGGLTALKEKLGIETSRKPNDYWTPEIIEAEAKQFHEEQQTLTFSTLKKTERWDLFNAIISHYPGGIVALRSKLEIQEPQKPTHYWDSERVKKEAEEFLHLHGHITHQLLTENDQGGLSIAIRKYYPGGMRALKKSLEVVEVQKPQGYWTPEIIEADANAILASQGNFSETVLRKLKRSGLITAIRKYYPGGITALREKLDVPNETRPISYWKNPGNIEAEARKAIEAGITLTHNELKRNGFGMLGSAASTNYPGGIRELRKSLGINVILRRENHWQDATAIEKEAQDLISSGIELSYPSLKKNNLGALSSAISTNYPGGINALKEKLGIDISKRGNAYWHNQSTIEEEARRALENGIPLKQNDLTEAGLNGLAGAITLHYPGSFTSLRQNLGITNPELKKPNGFWQDIDNIEAEASKAVANGIALTQKYLSQAGLSGLGAAIVKHYPGHFQALRSKLGEPRTYRADNKPQGFWQNAQNIEQEAQNAIDAGIKISSIHLQKARLASLYVAINKYYPGGMRALKEKLGISDLLASVEAVSPDQANEQLGKLVGVNHGN